MGASKSNKRVNAQVVVFDALGNEVRLGILELIGSSRKPLHIKGIARQLKIEYAAVYRHVEVLKDAGLVDVFEVGRSRVPSIRNSRALASLLQLASEIITESITERTQ